MSIHLTPSELSEAIEKLRYYRSTAQFESGHQYAGSLPRSIKKNQKVAIEITQLYMVQGQYFRAAEACKLARKPLSESTQVEYQPDIFDDDSVCLALIDAYLGIIHTSKLYTALRIANTMYEYRLGDNVKSNLDKFDISIREGSNSERIHDVVYQCEVLKERSKDEPYQGSLLISESRFWYYNILVVCAEQGITDEPVAMTKARAAKRTKHLHHFMEHRGRFREARYLLYFSVGLLGNDTKARIMLEGFLKGLENTKFNLEKGQTHLDLAEWHMKFNSLEGKTAIEENLKAARRFFDTSGYAFGSVDIDNSRLLLPDPNQGPDQVFSAKCRLADQYLSQRYYLKALRCLLFSIPAVLTSNTLNGLIEEKIGLVGQLISESGAEHLSQVSFIHITSQALLRAPEYGHALKSLELYTQKPPEEISPKYHSYLYLSLRKIYGSLGNYTLALEYAREALRLACNSRNSYIDQSDAALELGIAQWDVGIMYATGSEEERQQIEEAIRTLEEWVEKDSKEPYLEGERMKYHQLYIYEDYLYQVHHIEEAGKRAKVWLERYRKGQDGSISPPHEDVDLRVRQLITESQFKEAVQESIKGLEYWQALPEAPVFQIAQALLRVATSYHFRAKDKIKHYITGDNQGFMEVVQDLFAAMQYSYEALKNYRSLGGAEIAITCTNHIWLVIQDVKNLFPDIGLDLLKAYLQELEKTEAFCDSIRRSLASSKDIKSLLTKRQIVSNEAHRKLYSCGVLSCLQSGDVNAAWIWVQKGKARALSDTFGLRAIIPKSLLGQIQNDSEAFKLYQQESQSVANLIHASPQAYIGASRKAMADREAMSKVPILSRLLALREGAFDIGLETSSLESSLKLSGIEPEKLKYVDWYFQLDSKGAVELILLFVRDMFGKTTVRELDIKFEEVERWIQKVFNSPEGAEPELKRKSGNRTLWELNGLLKGLDELTAEDDLLVLSPTGILNSVPLHGLKVGNRVLIDRNLIIYSSSAAVLRHCQTRAAEYATANVETLNAVAPMEKNIFMALYEDQSQAAVEERSRIFASVTELAKDLPGSSVTLGQEVTKANFQEESGNSSWLFYHGHAMYSRQKVLDSGLVLSDDDLTISDIFQIEAMQHAPHMTIIACDSGTQEIAPGDEPLGVIPALLFAGATSVLGCIWPIESWAGRAFSEKFYHHLNIQGQCKQPEHDLSNVINIAAAVREAVREMLDKKSIETRLPYFWASFVLHGAWFHKHY